jgi:hypothetical protein
MFSTGNSYFTPDLVKRINILKNREFLVISSFSTAYTGIY